MNKSFIAGSLMLATLLAPVASFAQHPDGANNHFCSNLSAKTAAETTKLQTLVDRYTAKKDTRLQEIEQHRTARDAERSQHIQATDTHFDDRYATLAAKATTPEQSAAVAAFQSVVESALTTERAAIAAAVADYRTGVDDLINQKLTTADARIATLTSAINGAISQAQQDCAAGGNEATIASAFKTAVANARSNFKASPVSLNIKTELASLESERQAAVDQAVTTFKASLDSAKATLEQAFHS